MFICILLCEGALFYFFLGRNLQNEITELCGNHVGFQHWGSKPKVLYILIKHGTNNYMPRSIIKLLKIYKTVFQSDCTILYSQQQYTKIQVSQYPCQQCQGQNFSELTEVYFKTKVVTFAFTLIPSEIIVIILSYCNSLRRENSLSSQLAIVKTRFSSTPFLSSIRHIQIDLISLFLREREREKRALLYFPD